MGAPKKGRLGQSKLTIDTNIPVVADAAGLSGSTLVSGHGPLTATLVKSFSGNYAEKSIKLLEAINSTNWRANAHANTGNEDGGAVAQQGIRKTPFLLPAVEIKNSKKRGSGNGSGISVESMVPISAPNIASLAETSAPATVSYRVPLHAKVDSSRVSSAPYWQMSHNTGPSFSGSDDEHGGCALSDTLNFDIMTREMVGAAIDRALLARARHAGHVDADVGVSAAAADAAADDAAAAAAAAAPASAPAARTEFLFFDICPVRCPCGCEDGCVDGLCNCNEVYATGKKAPSTRNIRVRTEKGIVTKVYEHAVGSTPEKSGVACIVEEIVPPPAPSGKRRSITSPDLASDAAVCEKFMQPASPEPAVAGPDTVSGSSSTSSPSSSSSSSSSPVTIFLSRREKEDAEARAGAGAGADADTTEARTRDPAILLARRATPSPKKVEEATRFRGLINKLHVSIKEKFASLLDSYSDPFTGGRGRPNGRSAGDDSLARFMKYAADQFRRCCPNGSARDMLRMLDAVDRDLLRAMAAFGLSHPSITADAFSGFDQEEASEDSGIAMHGRHAADRLNPKAREFLSYDSPEKQTVLPFGGQRQQPMLSQLVALPLPMPPLGGSNNGGSYGGSSKSNPRPIPPMGLMYPPPPSPSFTPHVMQSSPHRPPHPVVVGRFNGHHHQGSVVPTPMPMPPGMPMGFPHANMNMPPMPAGPTNNSFNNFPPAPYMSSMMPPMGPMGPMSHNMDPRGPGPRQHGGPTGPGPRQHCGPVGPSPRQFYGPMGPASRPALYHNAVAANQMHAPPRKPTKPNPVEQLAYEAWVEQRKAMDPNYALECKRRQARRAERARGVQYS